MRARFVFASALVVVTACSGGSEEEATSSNGATAGKSGASSGGAGKGGAAGSTTAGQAGGPSGAAGQVAGQSGSAGSGGGQAGASGSGAGQAGASGSGAGQAGASGSGAGQAGASGSSAGKAGAGGGCLASTQQAKTDKLPVDVIVYIDTSDSMMPAVAAVEGSIDTKLSAKMAASGLDFRVIMLAGKKVPQNPADPSRWFYYLRLGGSGALHENLLQWFSEPPAPGQMPTMGYSEWLRKTSFKTFVVISDTSSGPTLSAASFDQQLLALPGGFFGTAAQRQYRYHAIVGLMENNPPNVPWPPTAPVQTGQCSGYPGALGSGDNAQGVAILTGGLRFPLCQLGAYDAVFDAVATGIVQTTGISCTFPAPSQDAMGKPIDPNTYQVKYTPGNGGPATVFTQVKDAASCQPGTFYIAQGVLTLCPDVCSAVKVDGGAKLDLTYGCDVGFKP